MDLTETEVKEASGRSGPSSDSGGKVGGSRTKSVVSLAAVRKSQMGWHKQRTLISLSLEAGVPGHVSAGGFRSEAPSLGSYVAASPARCPCGHFLVCA